MDLEVLGRLCREVRTNKGLLQRDVAKATGYSPQAISLFELGKNDNISMLTWYVENGLDFTGVVRHGKNNKNTKILGVKPATIQRTK